MAAPNGCTQQCCKIFHTFGKPPALIVRKEDEEVGTLWLSNLEVLPGVFEQEDGQLWQAYRCKLQDPDTGLCTIYERRPQLCRDYPQGKCDYGCDIAPASERDGE